MRRLQVVLEGSSYDVVVGPGATDEVADLLVGRRRAAIVTQDALGEYATRVAESVDAETSMHTIGPTEGAKTLATVESLCRSFASSGLLRDDVVVAVGGGVVGDTAGFAAAVYHRGIALVHVPTTLLAQVDAAIGGKTAVNLPEGKNLVGAFHQPIGVLADTNPLATLPDGEYRAGLGEVAKYALLGDADLGALLTSRAQEVLARDALVLEEVVARSAMAKIAVVVRDEHERSGARATLNYGHTLAHALESLSNYRLSHGEAVATGLVFASELAGALELLDASEVAEHRSLVEGLGLPTSAPLDVTGTEVRAAMRRDKKSRGGLTFVLRGTNGIQVVVDPPEAALARAFAAVGIEPGGEPSAAERRERGTS